MEHHEVVILGGGPAGLTSAVYAKRAGLDVIVLEKGAVGGQPLLTNDVENWPGAKTITGFELASSFQEHAEHLGVEIRAAAVLGVDFSGSRKTVRTDKGEMAAGAIIVATGVRHTHLNVPGEDTFTGSGVSYCAMCDGPFFRNEEVVVVGGGDTAVEEGGFLTRFASKVYIVHRRDTFRAIPLIARRALANPKIEPVWDTVVTSINGNTGVESVSLKNVKTGAETILPATGVFVFIGNHPNSEIYEGSGLAMTPEGWISADPATLRTNIPGVFAAGDVRETSLRQVVTAAADGARAAMAAYAYLEKSR